MVVPTFPQASETFIVAKVLGLLKRGWDVHVVGRPGPRSVWALFPELARVGRRRVHTPWPHRPRWLAALLTPASAALCLLRSPAGTMRYLARGWRRFGPGVLRRLYLDAAIVGLRPGLVHFEFGAIAAGRAHLGDLLGCRTVVSFRGYDLNFAGLEHPGFYDDVWREADALHFLGRDLRQRAIARGCPPEKAHALIAPAVDAAQLDPGDGAAPASAGAPGRPLRILSVGRLEWKKGHEYALQSVRLLHDAGLAAEYRIVGDGAFREAVAFARHDLGLDGCVRLMGVLPPRTVRQQMLWADVLLHAAVSEGFCNAVMEAQAMGLPVVCTDAGGLPENVVDGVTGFVAPRRDPAGLAEGLLRLARDPGLRQRMGEAGRRRVESCFRPEDQIRAFEELYRRVGGPR